MITTAVACQLRRPRVPPAMLYMMNPVWGLIEVWPIFARGRIALDKVEQLGLSWAAGADQARQVNLARHRASGTTSISTA